MPELAFLFTLGAAASLIGDHSHVATRTTEYLTDAVPFIWSSPIWFALAVGAAIVSLAELPVTVLCSATAQAPSAVCWPRSAARSSKP